MNATPHSRPLPPPEPLPAVTDTPAEAFQAGWWFGNCVGCLIGGGVMYLFLHAVGRLVP